MAENGGKYTRRHLIANTAKVTAGLTLLPPLLRAQGESQVAFDPQAPTDILPGEWPALSDTERELLRIPLDKNEAKNLLRYKVNHYVLDQKSVLQQLKSKGYEIPGYVPAKTVMDKFYDNILLEYTRHPKWDKYPKETEPTVGSLWRRFWEHASNHYHEADLEDKLGALKKAYPHSPFPSDATHTAPIFERIIGEATKAKISYHGVDFNMLNKAIKPASFLLLRFTPEIKPDYEDAFAEITRNRPQLDFPCLINELKIDQAMLKITRKELDYVLGPDVVKDKLSHLRASGEPETPAPWAARAGTDQSTKPGEKEK